jgi:hypothetical protein
MHLSVYVYLQGKSLSGSGVFKVALTERVRDLFTCTSKVINNFMIVQSNLSEAVNKGATNRWPHKTDGCLEQIVLIGNVL